MPKSGEMKDVFRAECLREFRLCRGLMARSRLGEPTPTDAFRADSLDLVVPVPAMGWTFCYGSGEFIDGFMRVVPTFHPHILWLLDAVGDGLERIWSHILSWSQARGYDRICWCSPDPYLDRAMSRLLQKRPSIDSGIPVAFELLLNGGDMTVKARPWRGVGSLYIKKETGAGELAIQTPATISDVRGAFELQLKAGWGDTALPVRCMVPDMLGPETGGAPGRIILAKDRDQVVGFLRITASEKQSTAFAHEAIVSPKWQARGVGTLLGMSAAEQLESMGIDTVYSTVDPMNLPSLLMSVGHLGGRGLWFVDDLYGRWFTPAHGGTTTPRFILEHRHEYLEREVDWESARAVSTAGVDVDGGTDEWVELRFRGRPSISDEVTKRQVVDAIMPWSRKGYVLEGVRYAGDSWSYLMHCCRDRRVPAPGESPEGRGISSE